MGYLAYKHYLTIRLILFSRPFVASLAGPGPVSLLASLSLPGDLRPVSPRHTEHLWDLCRQRNRRNASSSLKPPFDKLPDAPVFNLGLPIFDRGRPNREPSKGFQNPFEYQPPKLSENPYSLRLFLMTWVRKAYRSIPSTFYTMP